MTVQLLSVDSPHEEVVFCHDSDAGLSAVIALYSTARGPALGGVRYYPYPTEDAAVADVLNLAQGMAYKNALAGLPVDGGKAVIIGDPERDKTPELLASFGRYVDSLGGRYITACDVGTYVADMDAIATQTAYVTSKSTANGGAGDPSPYTAYGVLAGMRACLAHRWGSPDLRGERVGVAGVGKVGHILVEHLLQHGAEVLVTDVRPEAVQRVRDRHPEVDVIADVATLIGTDLDIFAPCALGGVLDDDTVRTLQASIVCGGANNQLAHPGIERDLAERGVLYAPDYVVNAGGVIHVADELEGYDADRVRRRTERIYDTTAEVLALADADGVPAATAADRLAQQRLSGTAAPA